MINHDYPLLAGNDWSATTIFSNMQFLCPEIQISTWFHMISSAFVQGARANNYHLWLDDKDIFGPLLC